MNKHSQVTSALYDLHWLPVHAHIHFKILDLAFKVIHGLASLYISDLISVRQKSSYNLRSDGTLLLEPSREKRLSMLGARSFMPLHHVCGIVCLLN